MGSANVWSCTGSEIFSMPHFYSFFYKLSHHLFFSHTALVLFNPFLRIPPLPSSWAPIPSSLAVCVRAGGRDKNVKQETIISWHHCFLFLSPISSSYAPRCTRCSHFWDYSLYITWWGQSFSHEWCCEYFVKQWRVMFTAVCTERGGRIKKSSVQLTKLWHQVCVCVWSCCCSRRQKSCF